MTRCPVCGQANPDLSAFCARCGVRLGSPAALSVSQWLDPASVFLSALVALLILLVYGLLFDWTFFPLPRAEGRMATFHLVLGAALGLGCAVVRRARLREYPWWFMLGLLAGGAAWCFDFIYNYQHWIYRLIFFVADNINPWTSVSMPFHILQALRYLVPCLVLSLGLYLREGSWRAWIWYLGCAFAGAALRAGVLGRPLASQIFAVFTFSPSGAGWMMLPGDQDWLRLEHLFLYYLSIWVVLYGLGRSHLRR